jgi:hypothetical protein
MKTPAWLLSLSVLLVWVANPSHAQSPAGPELLLNERLEGIQIPYAAACDSTASCAVVWYDFIEFDPEEPEWLYGRSVGPQGQLDPQRELRSMDGGAAVDLRSTGEGFLLAWLGRTPLGDCPNSTVCPLKFQELGSNLLPRSEIVEWMNPPVEFPGFEMMVPTSQGRVVLWYGYEPVPPVPVCEGCELDVYISLLSEAGSTLIAKVALDQNPGEHREFLGDAVADPESRLLVAFVRFSHDFGEGDIYLRRFSPSLEPLGPPVRINQFLPGGQIAPAIAVAPSGEFVVTWMSEAQDGDQTGIYARRFGADGEPLGDEFQVNTVTRSAQRAPKVVMDEHGNFVVIWHGFTPGEVNFIVPAFDIKARLFRADGTPVGDEIFLNRYRSNTQEFPRVAFAPNGTFFAAWSSNGQSSDNSQEDVYARRFSASSGEEICWWADGSLRCDLGRTGGEPELWSWAGWVSLDGVAADDGTPLMGDWDGDGREDLCAWQAGQLACDLDHEGRPLEGQQSFGAAGDTPLLGDVDGDGRADLCVRRKRRVLCDTARDGGFAELQTALGTLAGVPLLGDLDGDGRDDVCLYRGGAWNCTLRAGGRLHARFGNPSTPPALGDVDGDGLADFCVLAGGSLHCDTARDGGGAEWSLALHAPPTARLLLGNLDGL